ncbi:prolyl aminopeptidase [Lolliginicoccus suaedae]|uniref:prolyl aminopeptidase n=1 Tax=Lolliginicoccus suaedae TaxID=2605429 RepID=UPI001F3E1219|nr:prolyl aminopeptidase [Lolliginicoccus suaedae]
MTRLSRLHPPLSPHEQGFLGVGCGQRIFWQISGNPLGIPVLVVHGGPGSGSSAGARRFFDPSCYRIIQVDQRGCGRSEPHASDAGVSLAVNTTDHLVSDMEALREHLRIERWMLAGGSWGSTLILAYAQAHLRRVSAILLMGVTTTTRDEIEWLYRGVGRLLPAQWEAFRDGVPEGQRDGDLVIAYHRLIESADETARQAAARGWCAWEDAVIAHEVDGAPGAYSARPDRDTLAFVRICTHYFAHDAWLAPGQLLDNMRVLYGIPAVLLHGALDLAAPLRTAWSVAQAWPGADLRVLRGIGHTGGARMHEAAVEAAAELALLVGDSAARR